MGYKTKSMINAVGSIYGGGNVDPGYDSAAYLKTNLEDAGGQFGSLAGNLINKKKGLPLVPPPPLPQNPGTQQGTVVVPLGGTTNNTTKQEIKEESVKNPANEDIETEKSGAKRSEELLESLGIDTKTNPGTMGDGLRMMGDGFNKGMLRKNKYKK